ncbi:MAG: hypothetical protein KAH56_11350 [Candidatus Krumholzibacteria bacterium]|nr:hypothetical protein [Candidatus Krumholzibacteria bacterium]
MNGKAPALNRSVMTAVLLTLLLFPAVLLPGQAGASTWCGENGLIRFSFVEGDSLVSVLDTGEPVNGVTTFEVFAWLTDVDEVALDGEAFLHLGGMEFKLTITGAEAFILEQTFPSQALNVGQEMGHIAAGLHPGERIRGGKVLLVRWKVMIQGRPENIRLGLDPKGLMSCADLEGCPEGDPQALYVGNESSRHLGNMFGAGYVPSWINPTGEPDQTPVHGKQSWRDVGLFEER